MKYTVSAEILGNAFMVPYSVADKYLKLASATQLKVLLYCFRNLAGGINPENIAEYLKTDLSEVVDALDFWVSVGIIKGEETKPEKEIKAAPKIQMPTRQEVIKRGAEDENVTLLMREAQTYFGNNLTVNESSYLLYLYDDCKMDVTVILYLLSYASTKNKCKLPFIKSVANRWLENDVETVTDADKLIASEVKSDLAWSTVEKTFGIERRKPSKKEAELSNKWINEWGISVDLLKHAYDVCVDKKTKLDISYIGGIIESWHKNGIKTPEEAQKSENKKEDRKKYGYAGYDLSKFEDMLNKDD